MRIEGRDNASSLLNSTVDKNLLFSEDIVHSSLNPIVPATNTATMVVNSVSGKVLNHDSITDWNTTALAKTLLFTRDGSTEANNMIFIGEVSSATTTATTLTHKPLANISGSTTIFYYDPFTEATYFSGTKAIGSNPSVTESSTDFSGISDKGIIFQDSFSFDRSVTTSRLEGTSNSGSF